MADTRIRLTLPTTGLTTLVARRITSAGTVYSTDIACSELAAMLGTYDAAMSGPADWYTVVFLIGTASFGVISGYWNGAAWSSQTDAVRSAVATAGTSTTLTLDASSSAVDGFYTGDVLRWLSGANTGVMRTITGYVGSTKVATFARTLPSAADATPGFTIQSNMHAIPGSDGKALISTDAQDLSATLSVNTSKISGTAQTGRDLGASVLIAGDLSATMKTSVITAATAATPTAAAVTGAVGSVTGLTVTNLDATVSSRSTYAGGAVASVTADVGITQAGADKVWASAARTLTSFSTLVADTATAVWGAVTRVLTAGTNIVLAKGVGITGFNDETKAAIASQVRTELAVELARMDAAISSRLASGGYTSPMDAAAVRAAIGLATADLDTQLIAPKTLTNVYDAAKTAASQTSVNQIPTTPLLASGYTEPDNAGIAAIKGQTDNLPNDPASNTQVNTRLAAADYLGPDNTDIADIKTQTDRLTFTGSLVNAHSDESGIGEITWKPEIATDRDTGLPIADVETIASSNEARTDVLASGITGADGLVTVPFHLRAGPVWIHRQNDRYLFAPSQETVS
jgi:hypothetical protein